MRNWLRLAACLIAAGLTFVTADHATAQQPIRIGVLLPLTGPFAKNGIENWEAIQIARDMINERGGINGQKIEFVNGDATSPAAAISETERLITKEGIKITTGSFASPLAIAAARRPNVMASFIGKRLGQPRSSRAAGSSTRFRWALRPAAMVRSQ
jgi:branched-chain amino acid transport system substrate-binding protein